MNEKLFWVMYGFANKNERLKKCAAIIAKWSQKLFIVIFVVCGVYVCLTDIPYLARYTLVPFIALCYNSFIRKKLNKKRPFMELDIEKLIAHDESGSCPSNHAASAMVIAMAIFNINHMWGFLALILALITGISRVMVGVHYPLDVIFGWVIGGVIGFIGCNMF